MQLISATNIDERLDFPSLIDALAEAFRGEFTAPARVHFPVARPGISATHLIMPAWTSGPEQKAAFIGTKIVSVFPDNSERDLPAVRRLCVAIGRDGRAARDDGRNAVDALAYRRGFRARGALSCERRRAPSAHGRRRRPGAAFRARASRGAADRGGRGVEPFGARAPSA